MLLCAKPALDRLAASTRAARPAVVGALSLLAIAPLLSLGAFAAMANPILSSHWRCGTGEEARYTVAPVAFFVVGGFGAWLAAATVGRERAWVDVLLRVARRSALVLAGILLVAAMVRAVRKPDPEHYIASLPQVGVIPPVTVAPNAIVPPPESSSLTEHTRTYEDRFQSIVVRRECTSGYCDVSFGSAHPQVPSDIPRWQVGRVSSLAPLPVRRDEKHDIWVLGDRIALRGPNPELIDIDVGTVADGLSAPRGWILGAAIGLLIAVVSVVRRGRVARRAAAIAGAAPGVHDQNGWISADDGGPRFRAPPHQALPVGPVLIVCSEEERWEGGPYRGDRRSPDPEVLAGSREAHLALLRGRMAALDAFALSALLLTAAPLIAAMWRGLVF